MNSQRRPFAGKEVKQGSEVLKRGLEDAGSRYAKCYEDTPNQPMRILLSFYRGHYFEFFLSAVFFALKHCCVWVLPIVAANIINLVVENPSDSQEQILRNLIVVIVLIFWNIPMNYLYIKFRSRAIRSVEAELRAAMVQKLQRLSINSYTQIQSGRLQSKIMRDVEAVETLSEQLFVNCLYLFLNLLVAFLVTGMKNRIVFLFFLAAGPVAALLVVAFRDGIRKTNSKFRRTMEETSAHIMEMVEFIPVTRAHALEQKELSKMKAQLRKVAEQGYRMDVIQGNFSAASWAVFHLFQVLCLGFTGLLALRKKLPVGDVTLYQNYFTTIVNQISTFLNLIPLITKGLESVQSIGELLLVQDIEDNKGKLTVTQVKGEFEFRNVSFSYNRERPVLSEFCLTVAPGETIAFVGESGAGKSTIINLVIGFLKPDLGGLWLDGKDLREIDLRSYRKHIAVVPQTSLLFSGTIRENITYGLEDVTEEKLMEAVKAANLNELVLELPDGLETFVGEHGDQLSGGQRQRVAIARALIRDPKIIVLDEATSALDSIAECEIQKALFHLTKNRTTFIVAHRLSTIRNADRIVVLNGGTCTEMGTFQELMKKQGEFYDMWRLQTR